MVGLSTSGSISFGCALVAGRNLVPQPAAGKTALRTRIHPPSTGWPVCRGPSLESPAEYTAGSRRAAVPGPTVAAAERPLNGLLGLGRAGLGEDHGPAGARRDGRDDRPREDQQPADELERGRPLAEQQGRERDADDGLEQHEDGAADRADASIADDE